MKAKPDDILPATEINAALKAGGPRSGYVRSICDPQSISREVIASIAAQIAPGRIGKVLDAMLDAKRHLKDGTELDDTRTQEAALKLYMAYMIGMPVQRSESVTVALDADSAIGLQDRLRNSPHLRESMRKMIERAEDVQIQTTV
jgi:hypothetical protein